MNVSLTPELEHMVSQKVQSGLYTSASEVVREALRLLRERDEVQQHRINQFRQEVQVGLNQLDNGEAVNGEDVFAELRLRSEEKRRKAKA